MFSLFSSSKKEEIQDIKKGISPPEMKSQSVNTPIRRIRLPSLFAIPLKQHSGVEGELCVKSGDHVLRGQPLTIGYNHYMLPVHAPTSGQIIAIRPHIVAYPSSSSTSLSVIIKPDGEDQWISRERWNSYQEYSRESLIDRIQQFGIAGLGGAGFPTAIKLRNGINKIQTLIINAAECEPYITVDDRLIQDYASQIIEGIYILIHILQPSKVLIGIEDNKPQAISILRSILTGNNNISICVIPTKYPSGSSKQLIQILTGKQIPQGGHSSDIGVLIQNIGTVFAIKRAVIDGEPLTERVITITGKAISRPGNVWARLGTPVFSILEQSGFCPENNQTVIMGGPLTGFNLSVLDVPIVKTTNCLLVPSSREMIKNQKEINCIRCGMCADACPMNLLPQQLYWYSKNKQHDKVLSYNLSDCIECGACAWVCPSNIPLVDYFRKEKSDIYTISMKKKRIAEAKFRFRARQNRLKREKIACLERRKKNLNLYLNEKTNITGNNALVQVHKKVEAIQTDSSI